MSIGLYPSDHCSLTSWQRRSKISSDPNNTTWSKSTDGFGHKILSAQGWQPGQLLGAKDAAQAEHFTAANASHIRVMLREDNLGLGAKLGKSNAESFGLSTLSGIFGRLNGKTDGDIEKSQNAQRDAELRAYQTHKFGYMTFVRGGLLVGDKMEEPKGVLLDSKIKTASVDPKAMESNEDTVVNVSINEKPGKSKTKKRKSDDDDTATNPTDHKKSKLTRKDSTGESKRSKKHKTTTEVIVVNNDETTKTSDVAGDRDETESSVLDAVAAKAARKAARRAKKEKKLLKKEKRKQREDAHEEIAPPQEESSKGESAESPAEPQRNPFSGRQAVRQRWIQQKRLASMDPRALNEILMLKTAVT